MQSSKAYFAIEVTKEGIVKTLKGQYNEIFIEHYVKWIGL